MSKQKEKRFGWVLKDFSSLQSNHYCYSPTFEAAGCNWRLALYNNIESSGFLSLYLALADPPSLPSGWRKEVKCRLTLVNKIHKQSNTVSEGQHWFDANYYGWGFKEFFPLYKFHARDNGFLVKDKLIIVAEVQILPAIGVPEDTMKITQPPSSDVSREVSDDDDASEEDSDDDDDDDDDDDASSPIPDNGGQDICPLNQLNAWNNASHAVGNRGMSCNNVVVSNVDNDDAPKVDSYEDGTVEENPDDDDSSLYQLKSMVDTSQTVENGGTGCNNKVSAFETLNNMQQEIQPAKETMDVYGFQVLTSQVQSVSLIFKRHPDTALGFRPKNQQIRRAYMDALLRLIETLCQSPEKLSDDDLNNADETLIDLTDVGFELDWLKTMLNEVSEKKKMEQSSVARLRTMEEQLQKLKHMVLDFESQLQKEKAKVLVARAPLSFKDVVY